MFSAGETPANGIYRAESACYADPQQAEAEMRALLQTQVLQDACPGDEKPEGVTGEFPKTTFFSCDDGKKKAFAVLNATNWTAVCHNMQRKLFKRGAGWEITDRAMSEAEFSRAKAIG